MLTVFVTCTTLLAQVRSYVLGLPICDTTRGTAQNNGRPPGHEGGVAWGVSQGKQGSRGAAAGWCLLAAWSPHQRRRLGKALDSLALCPGGPQLQGGGAAQHDSRIGLWARGGRRGMRSTACARCARGARTQQRSEQAPPRRAESAARAATSPAVRPYRQERDHYDRRQPGSQAAAP